MAKRELKLTKVYSVTLDIKRYGDELPLEFVFKTSNEDDYDNYEEMAKVGKDIINAGHALADKYNGILLKELKKELDIK